MRSRHDLYARDVELLRAENERLRTVLRDLVPIVDSNSVALVRIYAALDKAR